MFEGIGRNAVDGAVKRLKELVSGINSDSINNFLAQVIVKIPILGELERGYNAMDDDEKAEFMKNLMLALAAMAAKQANK